MEWVEKDSFDRLNKLFEISTTERNHQVLLMDKNLLPMVRESKSFILPIFPHLAPRSLVSSEHHMLKDLPCYEVARATDSKERQNHLEQKDKKRFDGMLRQAPTISWLTSSSIVRPPANKKGLIIQPA